MNTKPLGGIVGLALTVAAGVIALPADAAERSKPQASSRIEKGSVIALDRCPFYPSPVICRAGSSIYTMPSALPPTQTAADVEESIVKTRSRGVR